MHVLRLEFEGIGPFAQRQIIDFEELSLSGLFLLEGPTGAGKTTIVDAIVFALYGDVAGSDSSKGRIVSTHLPAGVEPFIDLIVDTSHGLLRVRRVPEYERPSKRGAGVTINKASIKLWKLADLDDEGVVVSTHIQEANDELARSIGLTKAQFTQTVVLPQGQFATFLKSKPEDRREVLQDIFGTELYERIATKLAEQATGKRRDVEKAFGEVKTAAANFRQRAWDDDASDVTEPTPEQKQFDAALDEREFEKLATLAEVRAGFLRGRADALGVEVETAKAVRREAAARLREVEDRNQAIDERDKLIQRQEELNNAELEVEAKFRLLRLAECAEGVRHSLDEAARSQSDLGSCDTALSELAAAVGSGPNADLATPWRTAAEYQQAQHEALTARGQLDALLEDEAALPQLTSALGKAESSLKDDTDALERRQNSLARTADEIEVLQLDRDQAAVVAGGLADARLAEVAAAVVRDAAKDAEQFTLELVKLRAAEDQFRSAGQDLEQAYEAARRSWLDSLAGTIAAELVDDLPCPVCGSQTHPAPAVAPAGVATKEQVQLLEVERESARERYEKAKVAANALAVRIEERASAANGTSAADAEKAHSVAAELSGRCQAATRCVREADQELDQLHCAHQEESDAIILLRTNLATRSEQTRSQRESLEQQKARVGLGCVGYRSVGELAAAISDRAKVAGDLAAAQQAKTSAEAAVAERAEALAEALHESGFATPTDARNALLSRAVRESLRKKIETHRQDCAGVAESLKAPHLASLGEATIQDTDAYLRADQAAEGDLERRTLEQGKLDQTIKASVSAAAVMIEAVSVHDQTALLARSVIRMAEVVNAQQGNELRMSLPTFVLLQRFEEVVDLANVRLNAMTDGRFELRRTDSKEGRSQKLGLGLQVIDHACGDATREPGTLSGGETFKASLAMALGLADSVTAEAGGVELNTLFVDEGFGSLDPESLDAVMDQLTKLRQGGRSVGVISHVAEMKQRIAERVSVRPIGDGTSQLSVAGAATGLATPRSSGR